MATAHPMIQPDGTTYNMGTHVSTHSSYKIIKIPPPQPGKVSLYTIVVIRDTLSRANTF